MLIPVDWQVKYVYGLPRATNWTYSNIYPKHYIFKEMEPWKMSDNSQVGKRKGERKKKKKTNIETDDRLKL